MRKWLFIALGVILLIGVGSYFYFNKKPSDTIKIGSAGLSPKFELGADGKPLPHCTPKQIAELADLAQKGKLPSKLPCSTASVAGYSQVDPRFPSLSPEFRFASQIGGVQPFINRESCHPYGMAALGVEWLNQQSRDKYENEVCGWRRGRPGCNFADAYTR